MKRYKIGRFYDSTVAANVQSFRKVRECIKRSPKKSREKQDIIDAIGLHPREGGARGFFNYLVRRGWLVTA